MKKINVIVCPVKKSCHFKGINIANPMLQDVFTKALNLSHWIQPIASGDYCFRVVDDLHLFVQTTPGGFFRNDLEGNQTLIYPSGMKEIIPGDFFFAKIPNYYKDEPRKFASFSMDDYIKIAEVTKDLRTLDLSKLIKLFS